MGVAVDDGNINFDMACVKDRLSEQGDYVGGIASCEVTWSPTMGKWIWSPYAQSFMLPMRPAVLQTASNGRTSASVAMKAATKPQRVNKRNTEYNKMYRSE